MVVQNILPKQTEANSTHLYNRTNFRLVLTSNETMTFFVFWKRFDPVSAYTKAHTKAPGFWLSLNSGWI